MKAAGFIIYRGPSLLDGAPIVAIVTGLARKSRNAKTGGMVQTYIIRADKNPVEASRNGADASICGDCKHRPLNGGSCYVVLIHGPSVVWRGLQSGAYMDAPADVVADMCAGRMVRLGTYGDPAAVPAEVWKALVKHAAGHTGYTHQWSRADSLRGLVMASVDSPAELESARAKGWRTFRVRTPDEPLQARESVCPASAEAGKRLTCERCGMCNGAQGRKGSIAIIVHGTKRAQFIRNRNLSA